MGIEDRQVGLLLLHELGELARPSPAPGRRSRRAAPARAAAAWLRLLVASAVAIALVRIGAGLGGLLAGSSSRSLPRNWLTAESTCSGLAVTPPSFASWPSVTWRTGALRTLDERLHHRDDRRHVVDVGRGVLGEDVDQLVSLAEDRQELRRRDALARLADEVLLARAADEVVVVVAIAHVLKRLVAAELLVAGLDVDLGVEVSLPRTGPRSS